MSAELKSVSGVAKATFEPSPTSVVEADVTITVGAPKRVSFSADVTLRRRENNVWDSQALTMTALGTIEEELVNVTAITFSNGTSAAREHIFVMDQGLHLTGKATVNGIHEAVQDAYRAFVAGGFYRPISCGTCEGKRCSDCASAILHETCVENCPECRGQGESTVVVVESPFAGEVERNVEYAFRALRDCIDRDESPYASHLLLTRVLDDGDEDDRARGLRLGAQVTSRADKVVVYDDYGLSGGMHAGIARAHELGVPVEYRSIGENPDDSIVHDYVGTARVSA